MCYYCLNIFYIYQNRVLLWIVKKWDEWRSTNYLNQIFHLKCLSRAKVI
uniref:Uncharacterized protein n=1 Tax=Meloidogyne enterolobii TaxID=390850 RepID=A0A6V7V854_MELEN|nr:unnamed protein product [Meloidogyne enterolobii]